MTRYEQAYDPIADRILSEPKEEDVNSQYWWTLGVLHIVFLGGIAYLLWGG